MKTRYYLLSIISALLVGMTALFVACDKDLNDIVKYTGKVVYINTTNPFPDLEVRLTDGSNVYCVEHTDTDGGFTLTVKVAEISGDYYILVGDSTCIPKKVELPGYGQPEVNLGTIEVEGPAAPTVKTAQVTNITSNAAVAGGSVESDGRRTITARGICYGKSPYPTLSDLSTKEGTGLGGFTSSLKDLERNTVYYVRAYATNAMGTAYGDQVKFTTQEGIATVTTDSVYNVSTHTAKCKGHIDSDGGFPVTKRGTCWSKRPDPTIDDEITEDGSGLGVFTSTLKNLRENTIYYVRTYATNATETAYGEQVIITTLDGLPVVKTEPASNIKANSMVCYGEVLSDCDIPVTARGFCYGTNWYPTIEDALFTTTGKGLGKYQSTLTKLDFGKTYFIRAYATNEMGTSYGEQIEVSTLSGLAEVQMDSIMVNANTITCYAQVLSDCDVPVTARGFCYSTTPGRPTLEDATVTTAGKGLGLFQSTLADLEFNTTYYIRTYATNAAGTVYGIWDASITTGDGLPEVYSDSVSEVRASSIVCHGSIYSDGGFTITERGFCYSSTNANPTIEDMHATGGVGTGSYSCTLLSLSASTTYYLRAYATNSTGTKYGEVLSVTTTDGLPVVETIDPGDNITASTITTGGQVIDDGGFPVTERGVVYSILPHPTLETSSKVTSGVGRGYYTTVIEEISFRKADAQYYICAYAINTNGISYGQEIVVTKENYDYTKLSIFSFQGVKYKLYNDMGSMTLTNAKDACDNLIYGGYTDWYLPNIAELEAAMEQCTESTNKPMKNGWLIGYYHRYIQGDWRDYSYPYWSSDCYYCYFLEKGESDGRYEFLTEYAQSPTSSCRVRAVRKVQ